MFVKNIHQLIFLLAGCLLMLLGISIIIPRLYFFLHYSIMFIIILVLVVTVSFIIRKRQWRNWKLYAASCTLIVMFCVTSWLSAQRTLILSFSLNKEKFDQGIENALIAVKHGQEGWGSSYTEPFIWKSENKNGVQYKREQESIAVWITGILDIGKIHSITYISDSQAEKIARKESESFEWLEEGKWAYTVRK